MATRKARSGQSTRVLLEAGTREYMPPATNNKKIADLDELLSLWEMARQDRHRKKGTRRQRMKGLFGGGNE